jgi:hypothetical protein
MSLVQTDASDRLPFCGTPPAVAAGRNALPACKAHAMHTTVHAVCTTLHALNRSASGTVPSSVCDVPLPTAFSVGSRRRPRPHDARRCQAARRRQDHPRVLQRLSSPAPAPPACQPGRARASHPPNVLTSPQRVPSSRRSTPAETNQPDRPAAPRGPRGLGRSGAACWWRRRCVGGRRGIFRARLPGLRSGTALWSAGGRWELTRCFDTQRRALRGAGDLAVHATQFQGRSVGACRG